MAIAASTKTKQAKTWKTMNGSEKTVFIVKLAIMVCSGGFIFGDVLTEGMDLEKM